MSSRKTGSELYDAMDDCFGTVGASEVLTDIILKTMIRKIPIPFEEAKNLREFAYQILNITNPSYSVILAALTYIDRYFNSKLRFNEKHPLIHYQLFLTAFLCAYKYVNERAVKNTAWIRASGGMFELVEINKMEKEFYNCIYYDLLVEDVMTQDSWKDTIKDILELAEPANSSPKHSEVQSRPSTSITSPLSARTPSLQTASFASRSSFAASAVSLVQKVEAARKKSWKGFLTLFGKVEREKDKDRRK
ncbi:hypothetical protein HDU79_005917 [Rhizoclosmatium sp. JEL0117]|nr:hypothetical protein HDU79_005917 [Rhizoclosmatium sp. JEL0117]